jgi:hypothetical protein
VRPASDEVRVDFARLTSSLVHMQLRPGERGDELLRAAFDGVLSAWQSGDGGEDADRALQPDGRTGRWIRWIEDCEVEFALCAVVPRDDRPGLPLVAGRVRLDAAKRSRAAALLASETFVVRREVAGVSIHGFARTDLDTAPGRVLEFALVGDDLVITNWSHAFERLLVASDHEAVTPTWARAASERSPRDERGASLRVCIDLRSIESNLESALLPRRFVELLASLVPETDAGLAPTAFTTDVRLVGDRLVGHADLSFDVPASELAFWAPRSWSSLARDLAERRGVCGVVLARDESIDAVESPRAIANGSGSALVGGVAGGVATELPLVPRSADLTRNLAALRTLAPASDDGALVGAFYVLDDDRLVDGRNAVGAGSAPVALCGRITLDADGSLAIDWVSARRPDNDREGR